MRNFLIGAVCMTVLLCILAVCYKMHVMAQQQQEDRRNAELIISSVAEMEQDIHLLTQENEYKDILLEASDNATDSAYVALQQRYEQVMFRYKKVVDHARVLSDKLRESESKQTLNIAPYRLGRIAPDSRDERDSTNRRNAAQER